MIFIPHSKFNDNGSNYYQQLMSIKSELIELQISDNKGRPTTYYTYDGYFEERDRAKIRQFRSAVKKRTFSFAAITALISYSASKRVQMASIRYKHNYIPTKGLLSGVVTFGVSYLLFDFVGTWQLAQQQKNCALNSTHLPLWKNKRLAVNPDRAYFQLVDSDNNEMSIFHSGLSPEGAAQIVPDKVLGSLPQKPLKL